MEEPKETNKLLKQMLKLLAENEARISTNELTSESNKLLNKAEKEAEEATNKIQSTFDRIHDKMFTFNNMLIAAFLGLSKFPSDEPIFSLWAAILPIINLIYLMLLEKWQMEIYRHAAKRMDWNFTTDVEKYEIMINKQNLRSLLSIITTFGLFLFLVVKILSY
ncbi:hypothetical protein [Aquimarina sp. RZ0]|uniref:hypothetical protein n=1 Tax=Aquimarina sp. RZ0 TaxID=2607730 RepID=UPI0011F10B34|nr:hypothetical protein [Aquimarina sp. RZ0]KAA1241557.1 hypothetical protein F0000_26445 [Aquimarina sp. RZ0]